MRMLDLFSCAGGAAMGYARAGWDVVGVDIEAQPDYPFEHHVADAIEYVTAHGHEFDAVHASPPCQSSSALTKGTNKGREYPDLIPATREALDALDRPYIIENVQGSSLRRDVVLCGTMFGLRVLRHRYFELGGWFTLSPAHTPHRGRVRGWRHGTYHEGDYMAVYGEGGGKGTIDEWKAAMGIDWTDSRGHLAEAIPPAYTEYLGRELLSAMPATHDSGSEG